jgi:hypothetical protein
MTPNEEVEPLLAREGPDPWAHRRAEPRPLALLWSMYLLAACLMTLGAAVRGGIVGPDICRPATRLLLAIVGIGLAVVWPMIRLSQTRPGASPVAGAARDALVLVAPVQLLIWPHLFPWLCGWPLPVVAALAAWSIAWATLVGGLLALALVRIASDPSRHGPSHLSRGVWMGLFLVVALAGPPLSRLVITLAGATVIPGPVLPGSTPAGDVTWLASPVFAVFELARERPEHVGGAHVPLSNWLVLAAVGALGLVAWVGSVRAWERRQRRLALATVHA